MFADLTEGQLHALRNMARKYAGEAVPFVNISDARRLTELGLAVRGREGWSITPEGSALLATMSGPPAGVAP
jgi:hypothetical protein